MLIHKKKIKTEAPKIKIMVVDSVIEVGNVKAEIDIAA